MKKTFIVISLFILIGAFSIAPTAQSQNESSQSFTTQTILKTLRNYAENLQSRVSNMLQREEPVPTTVEQDEEEREREEVKRLTEEVRTIEEAIQAIRILERERGETEREEVTPTPPTPPTPPPTPAEDTTAVSSLESTPLPVFIRNLSLGMIGEDVMRVQRILNLNPRTRVAGTGYGSPGNETTFFGSLTESAITRFQSLYGLSPTGYVDSQTARLLEIFMESEGKLASETLVVGITDEEIIDELEWTHDSFSGYHNVMSNTHWEPSDFHFYGSYTHEWTSLTHEAWSGYHTDITDDYVEPPLHNAGTGYHDGYTITHTYPTETHNENSNTHQSDSFLHYHSSNTHDPSSWFHSEGSVSDI